MADSCFVVYLGPKFIVMKWVKEVCVESFDEALRAVAAGATRIELCENLSVGGTTPSYGTIKRCLSDLSVPVLVMIRPRGGNFVYSKAELEIMMEDISVCKELGVRGVVLGVLQSDGMPDIPRIRQLIELARPMEITFHKAIDEAPDILAAAREISSLGVERILTSGGKSTATEGAEVLRQMVAAVGRETTIVVAGKVTCDNFDQLKLVLPACEFHGRRLIDF